MADLVPISPCRGRHSAKRDLLPVKTGVPYSCPMCRVRTVRMLQSLSHPEASTILRDPHLGLSVRADPYPTEVLSYYSYFSPVPYTGMRSHADLPAVLPDFLSWKSFNELPTIGRCSIAEPTYSEHQSSAFIIPVSDEIIECGLRRLEGEGREEWDLPGLQCSVPRQVSLGRFGRASCVIPVDCPDSIVNLDG